MYSYKKEQNAQKRRLMIVLSGLLVIAISFLSYEYALSQNDKETSVFKEEENIPVLALPNTVQRGLKPFEVEAKAVIEYFDGTSSETTNMTKFEGVYRANQGIDYSFEDQAFDVMSVFNGDVKDVSEDPMFGKSVTISSGDLEITYQSLGEVSVKAGDSVKQGDVIAKAGTNIYNKELGNHLHVAAMKNGVILDPKSIFDKTLEEIK